MASHDELRTAIQLALPDVTIEEAFGELTVFTEPDRLLDVLRFCKDDELLSCELLSDVSGVHWPAGERIIERQVSTSGWPEYRTDNEDGAIEVLYVLRSITGGHSLRLAVRTPDDAPTLPSSTAVYPNAANFHEREVYDMFGVVFEGHPDLTRILMPDDWLGHPHRKDYPLGGVEIPYKNDKHIPPPHERDLREVVGSHASAAAAAEATAAAEAAAEQDGGDQ